MRNRSFFRLVALLSLLAVPLVAGDSAAQKPGARPVVVGAVLSKHEAFVRSSNLLRRTYEFTAEAINLAGGVKIGGVGVPVKLEIHEENAPPDILARAYGRMADGGIDLFLGPSGDQLARAAVSVTRERGFLLVLPGPKPAMEGDDSPATLFSTLPSAGEMPGILFGYLAAAGVRASRVGIVHADDAFGREVLGAVESHLGAAASGRLARFSFPVGILDAEAMLQALGKPLPDLLVVVGRPEENSLAIRRARREAGSSLLVCAVGGLPEGELTKDKKRELDGTLVLDFWSGNWRTAGEVFGTSESFARTFKKVNGFDPDYHVASAALALLVVKRGIEKAGGTTARGVAAAIAALDEETVFGRAAFAGNGRIRGGAYLGEVRHGKIEPLWPVGRGEGGSPIGR